MNIEELENYTSMVLAQRVEARKQRILLKREKAKEECKEQDRLRALEECKTKAVDSNLDLEMPQLQQKKKAKLDLPDNKTIISNVHRYLNQEYKYLQLKNDNHPDLRPLGAITKRTSNATGVSEKDVRSILIEEKQKIAQKRKLERQEQRRSSESQSE